MSGFSPSADILLIDDHRRVRFKRPDRRLIPEVDQPAAGLNGGSSTFPRPPAGEVAASFAPPPTSGTARHRSPPDDRRTCPKAGRWRQQRFPGRFSSVSPSTIVVSPLKSIDTTSVSTMAAFIENRAGEVPREVPRDATRAG